MGIGLITFSILQILIVAQVVFARENGMLTVGQMQRRGVSQGLPLLWHLGIWGDFVLISPLTAVIVAIYHDKWDKLSIVLAVIFSAVITIILARMYETATTPEAHVVNGRHTPAGNTHLIYTAISLAVFLLFFFFTPNVSTKMIATTSFLLGFHLFLGLHFALGLLRHALPLIWYPTYPLRSLTGWGIFLIVIAFLIWRTCVIL